MALVILRYAQNQLGIITVELERPSPFFVILTEVKNLVLCWDVSSFLRYSVGERKVVFGW